MDAGGLQVYKVEAKAVLGKTESRKECAGYKVNKVQTKYTTPTPIRTPRVRPQIDLGSFGSFATRALYFALVYLLI